jgi:UPF0271 protein
VKRIDLNCDLGEGAGHDAELMPLITSANIACGAHAGDIATMRTTVALAQKHGVAIGAHPGFADREHFGRRELPIGAAEVRALVALQIESLREIAPVRHVKPHGALYNLAARDAGVAGAIVAAIRSIDPNLILFAPAASELARAGTAAGLRVAHEVFADRTYQGDGTLTPRSRPNALIEREGEVLAQALLMLRERRVRTVGGLEIPILADTLCLHGDGANAVAFARRLNRELRENGIELRAFDA